MFESDNLQDFSFTINQNYARKYEHNKKREDLHRLEEKYGKDLTQLEEESSGSEEDEDAIYDSISKDKNFLRVLSKLKSKDPEIYNKDKHWFEEDQQGPHKTEIKEKPVFLKDYERETLLGKGSLVVDSDDEGPAAAGPTYNQEQASLKEDLKDALNTGEDDQPLLTLRSKSNEEKSKEDEDYRAWLKGEREKIKDKSLKSDCAALYQTWSDPTLDENEKFLRDFILNKGWVEPEDKDFVPTYDEIINDDDEDFAQQETFERQFNFRFEEPDHELIKNYPRTIANSVRKSDDARKEKRQRQKDRKLKEKDEKRQEIERLKKLKFEEIQEKLNKLSDNAGRDVKPALSSCLDEDFSPEQHDKVMSELFDNDYYDEADPVKPVFSDSDDDIINDEEWFNKLSEKTDTEEPTKQKTDTEEAGGGMVSVADPDDEPTVIYRDEEEEEEEEEEKSRKKSWKRKRSKKFKEAVIKPKPTYNPDNGPFERYFDEYYKLDCEDVIGDTRCRFGYRKTQPCSYGLTVDEILMADDKELNQWYSFKKMMKYRSVDQENKDLKKFQNQRHNEFMKRQLLPSLYPEQPATTEEPAQPPTKKKAKKEEKSAKKKSATKEEPVVAMNLKAADSNKKKKKNISQARLDAYGLS